MSNYFKIYTLCLLAFAFVLAYYGILWYSLVVLFMSFVCYSISYGDDKKNEGHGRL